VITEPPGGAHSDWDGTALRVKEALLRHLAELATLDAEALVRTRQAKYEAMGEWEGKE
jgi:acetyl-CoA carboxylase carboxyl transferase subunit alpha